MKKGIHPHPLPLTTPLENDPPPQSRQILPTRQHPVTPHFLPPAALCESSFPCLTVFHSPSMEPQCWWSFPESFTAPGNRTPFVYLYPSVHQAVDGVEWTARDAAFRSLRLRGSEEGWVGWCFLGH